MRPVTESDRGTSTVFHPYGVDIRPPWPILVPLLTAVFMTIMDVFVVNVAIPTMQSTLGATDSQIQFVLAGYSLGYGIFLVTSGRLGDLLGRKTMFLLGTAVFTVASALCGLALSPEMLITCRVLQGVGASMLAPQVLAIVHVAFAPRDRDKAITIYGAALGSAAVAGQVLGGVMVGLNLFGLGWRPIFLINVPIGIAAFITGIIMVPVTERRRQKFDVGGLVLITVALLLLVYPLIQGREAGWPPWAFASLALAVPAFGVLVVYESRVMRVGGAPLLDLTLFALPSFVSGLAVMMLFYIQTVSFFLVNALFMQDGLGLSPVGAGLTYAVTGITFLVASLLVPVISRRTGSPTLMPGAVIVLASYLALVVLASRAGPGSSGMLLAPGLALNGVGSGLLMPPLLGTILRGVPTVQAGGASGILTTAQQTSAALGVAVVGLIFFGVASSTTAPADQVLLASFRSAYVWSMWFYAALIIVLGFALRRLLRRTQVTPTC